MIKHIGHLYLLFLAGRKLLNYHLVALQIVIYKFIFILLLEKV